MLNEKETQDLLGAEEAIPLKFEGIHDLERFAEFYLKRQLKIRYGKDVEVSVQFPKEIKGAPDVK